MSRYGALARGNVPQSEALDERQVENNAGGFVYQLDKWARLQRFLVLGSDAPTYYQSAPKLTRENTKCVEDCWVEDPKRTADLISDISVKGRAAKNDSAIFALALGATFQIAHPEAERVRQIALQTMPQVCRTATHLFMFISLCRTLGRGWGRALKRAVAKWYNDRPVDAVAFQAVKYRAREGYDHSRALRASHAFDLALKQEGTDPAREALYRWIGGKDFNAEWLPKIVDNHVRAMRSNSPRDWAQFATDGLPWEALPTEAKKQKAVWEALLPNMGMTAMIRELGTMTQLDTLAPLNGNVGIVCSRLRNNQELKKARIHPFNVLQAQAAYRGGRSIAGGRFRADNLKTWTPVGPIVDAMEEAFYKSFDFIEPTNKRILLALDVSGSMGSPMMNSALSVREASAAMCMATMRSESNWHLVAFSDGQRVRGGYGYSRNANQLTELPFTARDSLDHIVRATHGMDFGATDCALPMLHAAKNKLEVDAFVIYTDNETWCGGVHPAKALQDYRKLTGIQAKLIVVGMTATDFSIADPADGGMLDVIGFDSSCPGLIAEFIRG